MEETLFVIVILFLVLLVVGLIFSVIDESAARPAGTVPATILQLSYTPEDVRTGVGPAIGGNGGVAVTTSVSPEKWTVVVKLDTGEVEPIEIEKDKWADFKIGDKVKVSISKGYFSHDTYYKGISH